MLQSCFLLLGQKGIYSGRKVHLEKLDKFKDIEPDDMHKVALTYCELGYHRKAYQCFAKIVQFQPYDMRLLHFCGLAAYNSGLFAEAINCFVRILKIDPDNSLAKFYLEAIRNSQKKGRQQSISNTYIRYSLMR